MIKNIKCKSGMIGWRAKLRSIYATQEELAIHDEIYGVIAKLDYTSVYSAWRANPTIEGSVNPSDFCRSEKQWK